MAFVFGVNSTNVFERFATKFNKKDWNLFIKCGIESVISRE